MGVMNQATSTGGSVFSTAGGTACWGYFSGVGNLSWFVFAGARGVADGKERGDRGVRLLSGHVR